MLNKRLTSPTFKLGTQKMKKKNTEKYLWKMKWKPIDLKFNIFKFIYIYILRFSFWIFICLVLVGLWNAAENIHRWITLKLEWNGMEGKEWKKKEYSAYEYEMLFISSMCNAFPPVFSISNSIIAIFYFIKRASEQPVDRSIERSSLKTAFGHIFSIEWKRAHQMYDNCL